MTRLRYFWGAALLLLLIAAGCSNKNKVPASVIQPDEMGSILFDLNMAEDFVSVYVVKDSSKNKDVEIKKEYHKIFMLHNVTEQEFEKSYAYYRQHLDVFKPMMDTLNARAQKKRNDIYAYPMR